MSIPKEVSELFDTLGRDAPVDAAFLIRGTGAILASWVRNPVPQEMVTVMAATMMSSVATIVEVFGCPTPQTVLVNTEDHQILARKVNPDQILVLVSSKGVHKRHLYLLARQLVTRLSSVQAADRTLSDSPDRWTR